jgi:hypothetical protein
VIEAATEAESVKAAILEGLVPHLAAHTILATNTSSIPITRLAARTDRPERFLGVHFMNPVPVMQLVELIRGIATSDETFAAAKALVERLGKTATVAEDFPAFLVNRILMPMINEAVYALFEGVGTVESIDASMRLGANHPMGPARARRLHRPRHLPRHHERPPRRLRRHQVPALPAAREIRRGRVARPQGQARLLRLPRRDAGADAVAGESWPPVAAEGAPC